MAYTLTGVTPVDVYYCASNAGETAHLDELQELEQTTGNFRVIPWYSKEKGRLSANGIEEISGDLTDKDFFICGPPAMMFALKKQLKDRGVPAKRIHTEEFGMT